MDAETRHAMEKWPQVPAVFGWLTLDARGQWWIKNQIVKHARSCAVIQNNYEMDEQGRWFFQNGPQRVFVTLAKAPWVIRLTAGNWQDHSGMPVVCIKECFLDEEGFVYWHFDKGLGVVYDQDILAASHLFCLKDGGSLNSSQEAEWLCAPETLPKDTLILMFDNQSIAVSFMPHQHLLQKFGYQQEPKP